VLEQKWIFLGEAVHVIGARIGETGLSPVLGVDGETAADFRGRAALLSSLRHGALTAEGQPGGSDGLAVEYESISDSWWSSITQIGRVFGWPGEPPFDVTVVDCKSSAIRWTKSSVPPLTAYFRNIRIQWADIDRLWPTAEVFRTGFAGRPSSQSLIKAEMKRRAESGELKPTIRAESRELAQWLKTRYPDLRRQRARSEIAFPPYTGSCRPDADSKWHEIIFAASILGHFFMP
jgi:hypothetical protein